MDCQFRAREAVTRQYNEDSNATATGLQNRLDRLDTFQREEVSAYLRRYPEKANMGDSKISKDQTDHAVDMDDRVREMARDQNKQSIDKDDQVRQLADDQASQTTELDQLKKRLIKESKGGAEGINPQMAQDIRQYLMKQQSSVSKDMDEMLNQLGQ